MGRKIAVPWHLLFSFAAGAFTSSSFCPAGRS